MIPRKTRTLYVGSKTIWDWKSWTLKNLFSKLKIVQSKIITCGTRLPRSDFKRFDGCSYSIQSFIFSYNLCSSSAVAYNLVYLRKSFLGILRNVLYLHACIVYLLPINYKPRHIPDRFAQPSHDSKSLRL